MGRIEVIVSRDIQISTDMQPVLAPDSFIPTDSLTSAWVKCCLSDTRVQAVLPAYDAMCSVHICDANQARKYNSQYRHRDYATNVLSFPADIPAAFLELHQDFSIGDIIICASIVASEAREQHKEPIAHWAHLVVHGFLHLLGFDHIDEDDANTMEAIEIATLAKLGYTNPYKTVKSDHQTSILLETQ